MRYALRTTFSLKTFRRLVLSALGLVLIPVLIVVTDDIRGRIQWSRYQSDARGRGLKIDLLEFIPSPVPDEQNLAALPMFMQAFAALSRGESAENAFERPPFPKVKPGAGLDAGEKASLASWRDGFARAKWIPEATENAARDILGALEKVAPALADLHAGLQRPAARFPVEWENGMYCDFPHLATMDGAAYLLRLRAMAKLELGDSSGALADLDDLARLSNALIDAPTVVMALARVSIQSHLLEVVWHGLATRTWRDEQLPLLDAHLAAFDPLKEWSYALDSERGSVNRMFSLILNGEYDRLAAKHGDMSGVIGEPNLRHARKLPGWTRMNQVRLNRHIEDMIGRIQVPEGILHRDHPLPLRPQLITGSFWKKYYRAFIVATPEVAVPEERVLQITARFRLARIAVALERFLRVHGAYPERLDQLVPGELQLVLHEPTLPEPMRYSRNADGGYLLYSIGLNGRDDGGERAPVGRRVPPRDQPDWPWPAPPVK